MKITDLDLGLQELNSEPDNNILEMIASFYNYHLQLSRSSSISTVKDAKETFRQWLENDIVYSIILNENGIGFIHISHKGPAVMLLEDIFIKEEHRREGLGKIAIFILKEKVIELGKQSLCVNVIPRNSDALDFYESIGFDHLNMIELRMNFNEDFNRDKKTEILGHIYKI